MKYQFILLQDHAINHTNKPTLLGGLLVALVIAYVIAQSFRGKNFKKGTNSSKHGIDNIWWIVIAAVIFYLLYRNGKIG